MKIQDFVKRGITVTNDMGETKTTTESSIVFSNGWIGSIVKNGELYSVAVCDYNGYFNWNILNHFGATNGPIFCKNEDDVCKALSIIETL